MTHLTAAVGTLREDLALGRFFDRALDEGYAVRRIGQSPQRQICRRLDDLFTSYEAGRARRTGHPLPTVDASRFVWITLDPTHARALLRGRRAGEIIQAAGISAHAHWSSLGRGTVIPIDRVSDVYAAGEHLGLVVRERKAPA